MPVPRGSSREARPVTEDPLRAVVDRTWLQVTDEGDGLGYMEGLPPERLIENGWRMARQQNAARRARRSAARASA